MFIPFKKMHGAGNDFIVIKEEDIPDNVELQQLARSCCHRNFGIGADGLLVVAASQAADVKMIYYNSDGSIANMCGNGIRCFSKFVFDEGLANKENFKVETLAGIYRVDVKIANHKVEFVKVNMGRMYFKPEEIPVVHDGPHFIKQKIHGGGKVFEATTVLMGVPHTVIFLDKLSDDDVRNFGPIIENMEIFPHKTNVNFVEVVSRGLVHVKTWERGAGFTLACGTGVTSVCGVAHYLDLVDSEVEVIIDGGRLQVIIKDDGTMDMEGPAEDICEGKYYYK
ncbi:diaminopimelate epimerase [Alkaliphilus serpentinus]|uniref:Diaminopimelate epimerase n=1 Tax=Alkaliphilus serpentinus TaxID=1482731 RepID=A0A833HR93_9FIRM|nr:diaminopimelate epimerase [Alkaliphilus serpentinus]KAB3533148.1 diaminopimelate epimerase [Alkaliphilus serpentinus]